MLSTTAETEAGKTVITHTLLNPFHSLNCFDYKTFSGTETVVNHPPQASPSISYPFRDSYNFEWFHSILKVDSLANKKGFGIWKSAILTPHCHTGLILHRFVETREEELYILESGTISSLSSGFGEGDPKPDIPIPTSTGSLQGVKLKVWEPARTQEVIDRMSDTEFSENTSGSESREKTKQWLEDVLQSYYTYLLKKDKSSEEKANIPRVPVSVLDFDIGPGFSAGDGRVSTLSDLLSLHVTFMMHENEKTEHLIVKIPPNDKADREMAQMAQVDRREIHFYTEALPQLEEWAKSRNADIRLKVPRCYFAKYHKQPKGIDGLNLVDAESVLVLEDMRPSGYFMRDFNCGLSLEETYAALREIAIIHSLSWAMQETTGVPLDERWELTYRPHKAASAYKTMIEHGFPTLSDFLERQEPDGQEILGKLQALHPKAIELLYELLKPPPPPAPSCLTHMDFWCNNLLFRKPMPPIDNGNAVTNGTVVDGHDTECLILDWQMMAVSRPTHDVALLMMTSLTPEVRERNSERLLRHYWNVFQETASKVGVETPFDYGVIENEFKKSQLLALLLVIGSIDMALDSPGTEKRLIQALRDMAKADLI